MMRDSIGDVSVCVTLQNGERVEISGALLEISREDVLRPIEVTSYESAAQPVAAEIDRLIFTVRPRGPAVLR